MIKVLVGQFICRGCAIQLASGTSRWSFSLPAPVIYHKKANFAGDPKFYGITQGFPGDPILWP